MATMKKAEIEEKLIFAHAAIYGVMTSEDIDVGKFNTLKAEIHALTTLLRAKTPTAPSGVTTRGR
jgi:hypothetical protein